MKQLILVKHGAIFTYKVETLSEPNKILHSSVKQHENNNNHRIAWNYYGIIARHNKNYQLFIKEPLLIKELKPTLKKEFIIFFEGSRLNRLKVQIKSTLEMYFDC